MKPPRWVHIEEGGRIHSSVEFIPHQDRPIVIGPNVIIDSGTKVYGGTEIGEDVIIGHNSVIRFNSKIGVHSVVGNLTILEGNLEVGHHTLIHSTSYIGQLTKIGNYVFTGPGLITTNDPKMHHYRGVYEVGTRKHWDAYAVGITIEDDAQIGAGVKILAGKTIGTHAHVGFGSNVTNDIPPYAVAYGNPARVIRLIKPEDDVIVRCKKHAGLN